MIQGGPDCLGWQAQPHGEQASEGTRAGAVQAQEWYREDLVGQAVIESAIPREELFLTSKLHPRHHGYDSAMIQVRQSVAKGPTVSAHEPLP